MLVVRLVEPRAAAFAEMTVSAEIIVSRLCRSERFAMTAGALVGDGELKEV
jgi:hypothetical protein